VPTGEIVRYLAREHHIKIAGGLGERLVDKIFRIGHMAPNLQEADIDQVVDALEEFRRS
jgi:aspartate aminotransferase-like enzyme